MYVRDVNVINNDDQGCIVVYVDILIMILLRVLFMRKTMTIMLIRVEFIIVSV